jgi:hypothetical protein
VPAPLVRPQRSIALAVGHVVFAPLTGVWIGILFVFVFMLISTLIAGKWNPQYANPAAGLWLLFMMAGLPAVIPLVASLAAAYGFWAGHRWARRLGRLLALACIAATVNGVLWTALYAPSSGSYTRRLFPPALAIAAVLAFAWSSFVLARTKTVPAGFSSRTRSARPIVRGFALAAAAVVVAVMIAVAAAARTRLYVGREVLGRVQVLWDNDRAFVCASRASMAAPATLLNVLVQYDPLIPSNRRPRAGRQDLVVAEIGPTAYSSRLLVGQPEGMCYVHRGILHFRPPLDRGFSHSSATPASEAIRFFLERDKKWDGTSFRDLAEEEKVALVEDIARHGTLAKLNADEGWQEASSDASPVSFALGGTPVVVQWDPVPSRRSVDEGRFQRVTVKVGQAPERPLLLVRHGEHLTSGSAYEALAAFAERATPRDTRTDGTSLND